MRIAEYIFLFLSMVLFTEALGQSEQAQGCAGVHISSPDPSPPTYNGLSRHDTIYITPGETATMEAQYNYNCHLLIDPLVIEWYRNGVLVASGTPTAVKGNYIYYSMYTTTLSGDYQVYFQNYFVPPGSGTVTVIYAQPNSLKESSMLQIGIFPNPNPGHFSIQLSDATNNSLLIQLTDMQGEVHIVDALEVKDGLVEIQHQLPDGIYVLTVSNGEYFEKRKVVVKRN